MKRPKTLLALLCLTFTFASCVKVLSQRTDEQAWLEFDQEIRQSRSPASRFPSTTLSPFLRETLTGVPVRKLFLKCSTSASPETCYKAALTLQFDEIFRLTQVGHPELRNADYRKEQSEFLEIRSFANVAEEVKRFHQSVFSGLDLKAREHAIELFRSCENEKGRDIPIENFGVFTGAVSEMPKAVYACLARSWGGDQDQLIQDTAERLGLKIVTPEAIQWIKREQVSSVYESEINNLTLRKSKEELEHFGSKKKDLLREFNPRLSEEAAVKQWAGILREKYPYSPVEQWVSIYRQELQAQR